MTSRSRTRSRTRARSPTYLERLMSTIQLVRSNSVEFLPNTRRETDRICRGAMEMFQDCVSMGVAERQCFESARQMLFEYNDRMQLMARLSRMNRYRIE